jgi:hypothetical protein
MMPENTVRCDCGQVMCFACYHDQHECLYMRDPGLGRFAESELEAILVDIDGPY